MKAVIGGRIYNTETATRIAEYHNGRYGNDFRALSEALYRTARGAWFLAGEGGAATKYGSPCGDGYASGEAVTPLTAEEALAWLEEHSLVDAIEEHFSDLLEEA